jgi:hypothetical protein
MSARESQEPLLTLRAPVSVRGLLLCPCLSVLRSGVRIGPCSSVFRYGARVFEQP